MVMSNPTETSSWSLEPPTPGSTARVAAALIGATLAFGGWVVATGGFDGSVSRGELAVVGLVVGVLAAWKGVDAIVKDLKPTADNFARSWQWQSDLGNLALGAASASYALALAIEARPAIAMTGLAVAIVIPLVMTGLHSQRQAKRADVVTDAGGRITDWSADPAAPVEPFGISVRKTHDDTWVGELLVWGTVAATTAPQPTQAEAGRTVQQDLRKALSTLLD